MKFLVCEKQHSEGCDYTIGCGMRFNVVEATDFQGAVEKIIYPEGRDEISSLEGEMALSEIIVVPFKYITVLDVKNIAQKIEVERKRRAAETQEVKELEELKRLQAKYAPRPAAGKEPG